MTHRHVRRARAALLALVALAGSAHGANPRAAQHFAGVGNTGSFRAGGGMALSNPGDGGVDGAGDGFLLLTSTFLGNFGAHSTDGEFLGNYTGDGVGGISFWLKDVGAADPLVIRLALGPGQSNLYQYHGAFEPTSAWTRHYVNLSAINPEHWTQTHGGGTIEDALVNVGRVLLRHDLPPFLFFPDSVEGDMGVDGVRLHPPCPGETNGDDRIDFLDLNVLLSNFGVRGRVNTPGDMNNDGDVDFLDLNIVLSAFGTSC